MKLALCFMFMATACAACSGSSAPASPDPDDARLLAYATKHFDKSSYRDPHQEWGQHHGTPVVVDFICSDVCPDYTVRVIHYDLASTQTCASVGGVERAMRIPVSIAVTDKTFCFPKVITDNWDAYKRD